MDQLPSYECRPQLVFSEWNESITTALHQGAVNTLLDHEVPESQITSWVVPGSYELIYGCKKMQQSFQLLDAIIAIGSVIQGETKHFDYVCEATTNGIMQLNLDNDIPVMFCVLTDRTLQQAIDRSGGKYGNKGVEAAIVAIKMAQLRKKAK